MSRQSPPPPGRDEPWPAQNGRAAAPQSGGAPAAQGRPGPRQQQQTWQQPGQQGDTAGQQAGRQAAGNGATNGTNGRHHSRGADREHPTTLIPKIDETDFIPKVEDFGAVSQGHTANGFPTTDPDEYQPRHGSFAESGTDRGDKPPANNADGGDNGAKSFGNDPANNFSGETISARLGGPAAGGAPNGSTPNGVTNGSQIGSSTGAPPNGVTPNGITPPNGVVPNGTVPNGIVPNGAVPNSTVPNGARNGVPSGSAPNGAVLGNGALNGNGVGNGAGNGMANGAANPGAANGFGTLGRTDDTAATTMMSPIGGGPRPGAGSNMFADNERTEYFGTDLTSQFAELDREKLARDEAATNGNGNGFDANYQPGYDSGYHEQDSFADRPPVDPPKERGRTALRSAGEVLITAGMVVLLFVVYELYVTDIFSAQKQASATTALDKEWDTVGASDARGNHYDLTDGSGIAKLFIPSFGQDYVFTVIEGTSQNDLAIGPGHYTGSALPGQPGDFAVAGHRVGEGAPFDDLGLLQSCDSILIETQTSWYVYRMLPTADEVTGWATGKGKTAQCSGPNQEAPVKPLGGIYAQTVGQEIVLPSEGDVVAPVPHHYGAQVSKGQEASLLTLTTCNPKFSAAQRLIIHAILVKGWTKDPSDPNKMPPEMKETS